MNKIAITLSTLYISLQLHAQNIYPKKLDNCITAAFCLDCGDIKANVDREKFEKLITNLNSTNNLKGIKGQVKFQVLVDSIGKGCVLSHTDVSDNIISKILLRHLTALTDSFLQKQKGRMKNEHHSTCLLKLRTKK